MFTERTLALDTTLNGVGVYYGDKRIGTVWHSNIWGWQWAYWLPEGWIGGQCSSKKEGFENVTKQIYSNQAEALWLRACEGREGYCSSDLRDAAKWAIAEAFNLSEQAARSASLPANYQWSEGNREKFDFGRDSAADAISTLDISIG